MSTKVFAVMATFAAVGLGVTSGWLYLEENRLSDEVHLLEQSQSALRQENRSLERTQRRLEADNTRLQSTLDRIGGQRVETESRISALQSRVEELEDALADAETEQRTLVAEQEQADEVRAETRTRLTDTETALVEREAELEQAEADIAQLEAENSRLTDELAETRERLSGREETLAELSERLDREQSALTALEERLSLAEEESRELISQLDDGTTLIQLPERILFDTGSAALSLAADDALQEIVTVLDSFPDYRVSVVGHSDSRTISQDLRAIYPTNWELSAARASAAVRRLASMGVAPDRMRAVGVAATQPLVEEIDEASRRQNRRIEIVLEPPLSVEPLATP